MQQDERAQTRHKHGVLQPDRPDVFRDYDLVAAERGFGGAVHGDEALAHLGEGVQSGVEGDGVGAGAGAGVEGEGGEGGGGEAGAGGGEGGGVGVVFEVEDE